MSFFAIQLSTFAGNPSESHFKPQLKAENAVREFSLAADVVAELLAAAKLIKPPVAGAPYTVSGQLQLKWLSAEIPDPETGRFPNYVVVAALVIDGKEQVIANGDPSPKLRPIVEKIVSIDGELNGLLNVGKKNSVSVPVNLSSVPAIVGGTTDDLGAVVLATSLPAELAAKILEPASRNSGGKKRTSRKGLMTITRKAVANKPVEYSGSVTIKSGTKELDTHSANDLGKYFESYAQSLASEGETTISLPFVNARYTRVRATPRCELLLVNLKNLDHEE